MRGRRFDASTPHARRSATGATRRILLVEADEATKEVICATLRLQPQWEVERASTLLEAIRLAGERSYDAAVLDDELPDGRGHDILGFLHVGSPGIRVVLLNDGDGGEGSALHALSHGADDVLSKDAHLEQELPRRMEALLDGDAPAGALVETLMPTTYPRASPGAPAGPPVRAAPPAPADARPRALGEVVRALVRGGTLAAGVFDPRGRPLAACLPDTLDAAGLGFALATMHGQVGGLWTHADLKPTGYHFQVEVEDGLLVATVVPGTFLVALLLEAGTSGPRARERVDAATRAILAALGDDAGPATS